MPTLSVCLICRDEAQWIADCLRSIRPHIDEIVLVDTGSTDGTPDLAKPFGPLLVDFPWCDDFSAARNAGIDAATCDFVLILDPDEGLSESDIVKLPGLMARSDVMAHRLTQRTYSDDSRLISWQPVATPCPEARGMRGFFDVSQIRLFRRLPSIRYEGRIHEDLEPSIRREGGQIATSDLIVHHWKFLTHEMRQREKSRQYLALSEAKVLERSGDARAWRELGQAAHECGELERAVEACRRAVELAPQDIEYRLNLAVALAAAKSHREAVRAHTEALAIFPDHPDLLAVLGEAQLGLGDHAAAASTLDACLRRSPNHFRARNNMGVALLNLGRLENAEEHLSIAEEINPHSPLPPMNRGLIALRRGHAEAARSALSEALERDSTLWQAMIGLGDIEFNAQRFDEAETWYRRASEVEGHGADVDVKLCSTALMLGRPEEALRHAESAALRDPRHIGILEQVRRFVESRGGGHS
ncbi:tetratricopeptide repeat protein [Candidatus Sumerlaeota bacterium]|nr:tetratricopeptide repeat protein [Candidatus Sumerlaeota bacterium]